MILVGKHENKKLISEIGKFPIKMQFHIKRIVEYVTKNPLLEVFTEKILKIFRKLLFWGTSCHLSYIWHFVKCFF